MRMQVRSGGIPWWVFVGGIGFLIFGGWKGFFGAIAGVILIPIAIVFIFALSFFFWSLYITKKYGKQQRQSPFRFEREGERPLNSNENVIETEATVIKSEKDSL
jgi:hypothetical protein